MKKLILIFFALGLGSLYAQSFNLRHNNLLDEQKYFNPSDSLKILAVLVEFKEDNDPNTFGTGKFGSIYTKDYGDTIIDPYPHDVNYFENHLEFAKNYFKKVSRDKLNISYKVLPVIITVSQIMRNYAPPPTNPNDLSNLAKLAKEVWYKVDSVFTDLDFSEFDLFIIFHAGVGNAYYPQGRLGLERDLPSVYLSENTLKSIIGNSFNGFIEKKSLIKNTIILPTTESKEIETFGEKILYQMSINGLIVGNIASYLGLPDLFDTKTGVTAIDRFGLMDGNALFAFNGLIPPEPSAWEKIFLGWIKPIVIDKSNKKINIVAHLAAGLNDTVVVKVPINSSEYYLIENRQRDVNKDGITVTYKLGNKSYTFHVDKDKPRFNFTNADTLTGVITDVDEFDWALPGNGIVIWHIDENIINEKISINQINADINHRGVDVEEADGIQDIGEHFSSVFDDFYGIGSEEDFWFYGNKAKLYENKFGPDTKPDTKSNTGAQSLITIDNFSKSDNKMSFEIKFGEDFLKPIYSKYLSLTNPKFISIPSGNYNFYYILDDNNLIALDRNTDITGIYHNFSNNFIASLNYDGKDYVLGSLNKQLNFLIKDATNEFLGTFDFNFEISSPVVISIENNQPVAYAGTSNGAILKIYLQTLKSDEKKYEILKYVDEKIIQICSQFINDKTYFSFITETSLVDSEGLKITLLNKPKQLALVYDRNNSIFTNIVLAEGNYFYLIEVGKIIKEFKINSGNEINSFSLLNYIKKGQIAILINNKNRIESYNLNGVLFEKFPLTLLNDEELLFSPLSLDINNDENPDIIAISKTGNLYAFDPETGKIIYPFPLATETGNICAPVIFDYLPQSMSPNSLQSVLLLSKNSLTQWIIGTDDNFENWKSKFSNSTNNSTLTYSKYVSTDKGFFP